jgi:ribose-phosphate pyrophosphokinase
VVIIDDILDTGTTLVSACERLVAVGAREIYIMVTHGQFTGERWKDLWSVRVKRIFCTDTLPLPAGLDPRIRRLSIIPLLQRQLLSFEQGNGAILAAPIVEAFRSRLDLKRNIS